MNWTLLFGLASVAVSTLAGVSGLKAVAAYAGVVTVLAVLINHQNNEKIFRDQRNDLEDRLAQNWGESVDMAERARHGFGS